MMNYSIKTEILIDIVNLNILFNPVTPDQQTPPPQVKVKLPVKLLTKESRKHLVRRGELHKERQIQ